MTHDSHSRIDPDVICETHGDAPTASIDGTPANVAADTATAGAGAEGVDPQTEAAFWRAIYSRRLYFTDVPSEYE
jgi:hypothetical protein